MKCPHCHAEDQDGLYCAKCGKPLDESVSDLTRVMPPLEELHPVAEASDVDDIDAPLATSEENDTAAEESVAVTDDLSDADSDEPTEDASGDEADAEPTSEASDDDASDEPSDDASTEEAAESTEDAPSDEDADDAPNADATAENSTENDGDAQSEENGDADAVPEDAAAIETKKAKRRKIITIAALVGGITLAALAGLYLFNAYFGNSTPVDPSTQVKNADTIAPDTSLAEDTIVGHWRHYNTGSVIEKIGTGRYRWTIEDDVYQLDFKDNKYIYEDESGSTYTFVLVNADRIQLAESKDVDGGLITNPVFESGYIAGRVGQDGTMTKNLAVNPDAFNIVGRTYADLAGTYGPGSLSVVGDEQYIIFRADGGNFAVQFTGETVPLKKKTGDSYKVTPLASNESYEVVPLTNTNPVVPNDPNTDTPTTDPNTGTGGGTTTPDTTTPSENEEDKEYKVEIPDMPTFPSNSAVATGVVWADLGFVIKNAPDTMTVTDLSAVLGIALEVGEAPANASGFNFYGSGDGYFAGTYGINDHSFYISGYGKNALSADKTILFIQQIS